MKLISMETPTMVKAIALVLGKKILMRLSGISDIILML